MWSDEQIQEKFLSIVPAEAILVGHSIENDLQALKVLHRRVIDTSIIYPHPKGPPFRSALRFLASTYLNKSIQTGTSGHCSVEDAICTLQLLQVGCVCASLPKQIRERKLNCCCCCCSFICHSWKLSVVQLFLPLSMSTSRRKSSTNSQSWRNLVSLLIPNALVDPLGEPQQVLFLVRKMRRRSITSSISSQLAFRRIWLGQGSVVRLKMS